MAFDAGSIEATMQLDRSAFQRGLREARAEAERFERERFQAHIDAELRGEERVREELRRLGEEHPRATVEVSEHGAEEVKRRINALRERVHAEVDVGIVGEERLREFERRLDHIDHIHARASVGLTGFEHVMAELAALDRELDHIDHKRVSPNINTNPVRRALADLFSQFSRLRNALGGDGGGGGIIQSFRNFASSVPILPAAILAALPAVVALGAALAAMTASLAAATAGLGALTIAAGGALAGAVLLGVGAVQRFKAQADQAGTAAHGLKIQFEGLTNAFRYATGGGADAIFHGIGRAIQALRPAIRGLHDSFTQLGQAWGRAFQGLGQSLARLAPQFGQVIRASAPLAGPVTQAISNLARIFLNIAQAAMPELVRMAQRFADWLGRIASHTSNIGHLRDVIHGLVGHLSSWLNLIGQVSRVMLAFFRAAAPTGKALVDSLAQGAKHLADWMNSARGQAAIKQFFQDMLPIIHQLGQLFKDLVPLILQLARDMAPLTTAILKIADAVAKFLREHPALTAFIAQFVVLGTVALRVAGMVLRVAGALRVLQGAARIALFASPGLLAALRGLAAAALAALSGLGGALVSGVQSGLAFLARSIPTLLGRAGLIGALVGVAKFLYDHLASPLVHYMDRVFNQILVRGLTNAVRNAGRAVAAAARGVWSGITSTVSAAARATARTFQAAWNGLRQIASSAWNGVTAVVRSVWRTLRGLVTSGVAQIRTALVSGWGTIRSATTTAWNAIRSVITTVVNAIKAVVQPAVNAIQSAITTAWNAIQSATTTAWNAVKSIISTAWSEIQSAVSSAANAVASALSSAWQAIQSATQSAWSAISQVISSALSAIQSAVSSAMSAIQSAISSGWSAVKSATDSAWNAIKSALDSAWNSIKQAVTSGVQAVVSFVASLPGKVMGALSSLPGQMLAMGGRIMSSLLHGLESAAGPVISFVSNLANKISSVFSSATKMHSPSQVFIDHGRDLMLGLMEGIRHGAAFAEGAMTTATQGVINAVKRTAGISSPAHAFALLGHDIVRGLEQGIRAGGVGPVVAAKQMVDRIKREIRSLDAAIKTALKGGLRDLAHQLEGKRHVLRNYLGDVSEIYAYERAVANLGLKFQQMLPQIRQGFIDQRLQRELRNIEDSPLALRLSRMQAQDVAEERKQQMTDLQSQLDESRAAQVRKPGQTEADFETQRAEGQRREIEILNQIRQAKRQSQEEDIQKELDREREAAQRKADDAQTFGDKEVENYERHLAKRFGVLMKALSKEKISWGQFYTRISALLAPAGPDVLFPGPGDVDEWALLSYPTPLGKVDPRYKKGHFPRWFGEGGADWWVPYITPQGTVGGVGPPGVNRRTHPMLGAAAQHVAAARRGSDQRTGGDQIQRAGDHGADRVVGALHPVRHLDRMSEQGDRSLRIESASERHLRDIRAELRRMNTTLRNTSGRASARQEISDLVRLRGGA